MWDKYSKRIIFYGISVPVILILVFLSLPVLLPYRVRGPSFETQRKEQRGIVQERVQAAGGWAALRHDCEWLVTNSYPLHPQWFRPQTNARVYELTNGKPLRDYITNIDYGRLPYAIECLQPKEIEYDQPSNHLTVVQIKLFGLHRTGGKDIPYYGLWAVCGAEWSNYTLIPTGPGHYVRKVSDGIFEVYE